MPDATAASPLCVYCRRHPVEAAYQPFCSKRCQLLDLAHWVDGDYSVAGESMTDDVSIEDAFTEVAPDLATWLEAWLAG